MKIINKNMKYPVFVPSISTDQKTWFWKSGINNGALLISYDVLLSKKSLTHQPVSNSLEFNGMVIVDSGAFGKSIETKPLKIYEIQKKVKADVGVVLDQIPFNWQSKKSQMKSIDATIKNAKKIKQLHNGRMLLEGVIQGTNAEQRKYCAKRLTEIDLDVIGFPTSYFSKHKKYSEAVDLLLAVKDVIPNKTPIHAMGCGSRTLMAIFSYFGVKIFDSSSYYKAAIYGQPYKHVEMRGIYANKKDKTLRSKKRTKLSRQEMTNHNLIEILDEIRRIRIAIDNDSMKKYLKLRLRPRVYDSFKKYT